ncbi:MAG: hypothetical protein IPH53_22930 [Flavobacteriales bacterium]|nr:hypothetical protein [Flavobacteriales bacterium]
MDNKLLFATGSTVVEAKGKEAPISLAKAIESEKDLNVMVEGHTDLDRCWAVVADTRTIGTLACCAPPALCAFFRTTAKCIRCALPRLVAENMFPADPADKAKNRRIEADLAPDLRELYKLVTE